MGPAWHIVIMFVSATFMIGCPLRRTSHDYMFAVTGIITTEQDEPLPGVDVTLKTDGEVYEARLTLLGPNTFQQTAMGALSTRTSATNEGCNT